MRQKRSIVAVTLLATALCAHRAGAADASERGNTSQTVTCARASFAQRLAVSLRREIPALRLHETLPARLTSIPWRQERVLAQAAGHSVQTDPFYFRLPPPLA